MNVPLYEEDEEEKGVITTLPVSGLGQGGMSKLSKSNQDQGE